MQGVKNLTQGPILKQLLNLALPIMATSFVQMAYNLTDMAWLGRLGSKSVAAVGAVSILIWFTSSISLLTKVGSEVTVAQAIGAKRNDEAKVFASHNSTIALIISIVWALILFSSAIPIVSLYKLDADISRNAVDYLRIVSTAIPFTFLATTFSGVYNASGRSKIPFYLSGTGLVANMILDPLLIFGLGPIPGLGTIGAAIATWTSQFIVFMLFIYALRSKAQLMGGFSFITRLQWKYTKRILQIGTPVALLNSLFAVINMFMCRIASVTGGHIGLMSMTTGGQIEAITWNTSQGFSTALGAFVAQNFAASKIIRVFKAYRATLFMTSVFGIISTVLFVFFGNEVFSIFVPDPEAYEQGGNYLRISGYSQMLMMLEITTQGLFYGTGRTVPPAVVSVAGNVLRIPLALGLVALGWGIDGIWWAISFSCMIKGLVLFIWFILMKRRILSTHVE